MTQDSEAVRVDQIDADASMHLTNAIFDLTGIILTGDSVRDVFLSAFARHRRDGMLAAAEWQPIETAPFDKQVLVCCERFSDVVEAIQYRKGGWTTFGVNGPFTCRPTVWMSKPAAPTQIRSAALGERP